jgi:hypothetical protein
LSRIHAERLSQVRPESVRWLWKPYFPGGKLVLLDGDPGLGKSLLTLDVAARLSRGADWPNGEPPTDPLATIFLNAEDAAADTVRPRAEAAGADLDRLVFVNRIDDRTPRLPDDIAALAELVAEQPTGLVVIDPVMAFLPPEVAASSDQCVRQALTALADFAAGTGVAVVLVRHLNKQVAAQAIYRGAGSTGIIGATRTGLLVSPHPLDPAARVLSVTKSNLCDRPPSIGFGIRADAAGRPVIAWHGPESLTANQVCRPEAPTVRMPARDRATRWLAQQLAPGPRPMAEVFAAAAKEGISDRTLERARKDAGIHSHRVKQDGRLVSYWYDPAVPWPKDSPIKKPFELLLPPLADL